MRGGDRREGVWGETERDETAIQKGKRNKGEEEREDDEHFVEKESKKNKDR